MSLNVFDGFDCYDSYAQVTAAGWTTQAGSPTFSTTDGRFGGGCLVVDGTDAVELSIPTSTSLEDYTCGGSFYFTAWPTTGTMQIMQFRAPGDKLMALTVSSTGVLSSSDQGSLAGGSIALSLNTWYRIECNTLLMSGAAGTVEVQINGAAGFSLTGRDTLFTGGLTVLRFASAASGGFRLDDVTFITGDATAPNTFLGDIQIDNLRPDGDGNYTAWTPNTGTRWEAVDDPLGTVDDDTTYISAEPAGTKNSVTLTDTIGTAVTTHAFQIRGYAKKSDAASKTVRGIARSGAVDANGSTVGPTTAYTWLRLGIFTTDPDGGGALDDAVMDGMEVGIEVVT